MRRAAEEYKLVFFWVTTSFASVIGVSLRGYWKVPREPFVPGSHLFGVFREDRAGKFDFSVSQCRARVDNGSCMHWTGFPGDDALRAVFPSIVFRPRCSASWPVWIRRTVASRSTEKLGLTVR